MSYRDDFEPRERESMAHLRQELIDIGAIKPGEIRTTLDRIELPSDTPVLRLDAEGQAWAAGEIAKGRTRWKQATDEQSERRRRVA